MEFSLNAIVELINGVGFPIAVCVALFWLNKGSIEKQTLLLSELKEIIRSNSEIIKDLTDQIKRG